MVAQSSDAELPQNEDLFDTNEVKDQSSMDASEDEEENFPPSEDESNDEENFLSEDEDNQQEDEVE